MSDNAFPDALPPGYRLHWYLFERVLGQGGFGITYLARDTNLDQLVAIKEYLPVEVATRRADSSVRARTEDHDERYRWGLERFIREARTLARFDHPNIVRVLSVFESNETAYMVMRFEEGETLAALLERRHALSEADLMRVLLPILDGLELVHTAGFIHRDIKPDNIHIRQDGSPVLLDFGSARYALGRSRTVTILVAPGYAPFEQYYSSGENQGPWTDIYGLGATCYRAIAGRAPLDAITRSKGILGSTKEILVPAVAIGSGRYSEQLLKAIDHALAFAEPERPQSIPAWRKELPSVAGDPVLRPTTHVAPAPPSAAVPPATPAPERPRNTWSNARGPLIWGGAGAAAVIVALAALPWLGASRQDAAPDSATARAPEKPAPPAVAPPPTKPDASEERLKKLEEIIEQERQRAEAERRRLEEQRLQSARATKEKVAAERQLLEQERQKLAQERERTEAERKRLEARQLQARAEPPQAPAASAPAAPSPRSAPPAVSPPAPPSANELLARADSAQARGGHAEAAALLRPLADKQHPKALAMLGELHLHGKGVEQSDEEALRLFRRAAERGEGEAQLRLGDMYASGRGVPQNNFQAYIWYTAALRAGVPAAKAPQERIAPLLQPAERAQAMKLAETLPRQPRDR